MAMITVLFSCTDCLLIKATAFVRERGKRERMKEWMGEVGLAVRTVHSLLSPHCNSGICELMIPRDGEEGIGYRRSEVRKIK